MLHCKPPASPSHAGEDLVRKQKHAELIAKSPQGWDEPIRRDNGSGPALDGLEDNRRESSRGFLANELSNSVDRPGNLLVIGTVEWWAV